MTRKDCNVPGCDEPLGEHGVWCDDHYLMMKQVNDAR